MTFAVNVRLDNQGQCINTAQVNLSYPTNELQAVAASDGDSILTLWVNQPTIHSDYGVISFVGGLPGGYCGRVSGDPSLSNKLATLYFRFPTSTTPSSTQLPVSVQLSFLPGTEALLNDGQGTPAALTLSGATYSQLLTGKYAAIDVWQQAIQNDTTPPEPFTVSVYHDPSLFSNQWFATFSTVDKQTGIDHYEVAEISKSNLGTPENQWNWVRAVSPYLIKDQSLQSIVEVRAVDSAGNIRTESYIPPQNPTPARNPALGVLPYVAIIGVVGLVILKFVLRLF